MMKGTFNALFLLCWTFCLICALAALGGVAMEYAFPMYACGAALALVSGVKLLWTGGSWVRTPLHLPVIALLSYAAIRFWTAPLRHEAGMELLLIGLYATVYAVTATSFYRSRHRAVMLGVLLAVLLLESVYAYWQFTTGTDRVFTFVRPAQYHGRGSGTYICPNHLASLLEIGALLLLAQLVINPKPWKSLEASFIVKLLEFFTLAVVMMGLVATQSRGAWISFGVGTFVFWFWAWRTGWLRPRVADALLIGLLILGAGALAIPTVRERILGPISFNPYYTFQYDVVYLNENLLEGRIQMTQASWNMFRDHSWFGVGPGAWRWFHPQYRFPSVTFHAEYAHNDIIQFAAEYGLAGIFIALTAVACFLWQAVRLSQRKNPNDQRALALGSLLAIIAVLIHSAFDFSLHIPANALLVATIFGLVAGTGDEAARFPRKRIPLGGRITFGIALLLAGVLIGWAGFRYYSAAHHLIDGYNAQAIRGYSEALPHYQKATVEDPSDPEPHVAIGDVYRLQLKNATGTNLSSLAVTALDSYNRALQLNPLYATVWIRIAATHEAAGNTNLAFHAYSRAFSLDPNNFDYWVIYARFLMRLGRYSEAIAATEKAVAHNQPLSGALLRELRQKQQNVR